MRTVSRPSSRDAVFPFLPMAVADAMRARLIDLCGLLLMALGAACLVAFGSYNAADPSWNTAAIAPATNWMGLPGAVGADLFLQTLGAGAFIPGVSFLIWGYRIFRRLPVGFWIGRVLCMLLACLLMTLAAAAWPSNGWLPHPSLGGAGGGLMMHALVPLASLALPVDSAAIIVSLGALLVASCLWLFSTGIRLPEWGFGLGIVGRFFLAMCAALHARIAGLGRRANRPAHADDDFLDEADDDADTHTDTGAGKAAAGPLKIIHPQKQGAPVRTPAPTRQKQLSLDAGEPWENPPLDLLQEPPLPLAQDNLDDAALRRNAELLQNVLGDFNVQGDILSIHPGPVVTLYELEPAPGTKTSRVIGLSDDIARSMSAVSVRAAVVPGRNVIGVELPNKRRQTVYLRDLLTSKAFEQDKGKLSLVLGKDIGGHPVIADLARMPHLLVAGTTGSGKSVAVNTMILSLLYRLSPEQCRFIMIDPKMLELSVYDDIPHLLTPVVTEPGKAIVALKWAVAEMENRYRAMSKLGVRNIEGYNTRLLEARAKGETLTRKVQTGFDPESGKPVYEEQPFDMRELPYIVVVVDEFADLMLVAGKDVESAIQRLAQMARAAGIHLIMATQRPSVDVITGVIKANFPTRISFQVTSKIDSRTILGEGGAEQLLGMGDMLYMASGGRITRVHGPFVSDQEVESVVDYLRAQREPEYTHSVTDDMSFMDGGAPGSGSSAGDDLYEQAVALVAREGKASTSFIQRYFQIGYNRAARIIEDMERQGVISAANHVGKREVLVGEHRSQH